MAKRKPKRKGKPDPTRETLETLEFQLEEIVARAVAMGDMDKPPAGRGTMGDDAAGMRTDILARVAAGDAAGAAVLSLHLAEFLVTWEFQYKLRAYRLAAAHAKREASRLRAMQDAANEKRDEVLKRYDNLPDAYKHSRRQAARKIFADWQANHKADGANGVAPPLSEIRIRQILSAEKHPS